VPEDEELLEELPELDELLELEELEELTAGAMCQKRILPGFCPDVCRLERAASHSTSRAWCAQRLDRPWRARCATLHDAVVTEAAESSHVWPKVMDRMRPG
jgi:hypothetical protein